MSYVFFDDILEELGHSLLYSAIVNYAGNSFCEKSWDMIMDYYPMSDFSEEKSRNRALGGIAGIISKSGVHVMQPGDKLPGSLGKIKEGTNDGKNKD